MFLKSTRVLRALRDLRFFVVSFRGLGATAPKVRGRRRPQHSTDVFEFQFDVGLDRGTCELVLTNLVARRILKRAANGTYVRG